MGIFFVLICAIGFLRKVSLPLTLLVGMQTSTATMENSVEIS